MFKSMAAIGSSWWCCSTGSSSQFNKYRGRGKSMGIIRSTALVAAALLSAVAQAATASTPAAVDLGLAARTTEVNLTVALALRNPDQALELMQSLYRPGSPQFRNFLTPAKFTSSSVPPRKASPASPSTSRRRAFAWRK
jgi:hypothetical protein